MKEVKENFIQKLPSKKHLENYFSNAKSVSYRYSINGVYILEGLCQQKKLLLLVKPTRYPRQELFANLLLDKIGVKTPHIKSYKIKSTLGSKIAEAIKRGEACYTHFLEMKRPTEFIVQAFIRGKDLQYLKLEDLQESLRNEPNSGYKILEDIGKMTIGDLVLVYFDRIPLIDFGNLANVRLLLGTKRYYLGAIAIDQVANYDVRIKCLGTSLRKMLFNRIAQVICDIQKEDESSVARELIEQDLPTPLNECLPIKQSIIAIRRGFESTMKQVLNLKLSVLDDIHSTLPNSIDLFDRINVEIYKKNIGNIQAAIDPDLFDFF